VVCVYKPGQFGRLEPWYSIALKAEYFRISACRQASKYKCVLSIKKREFLFSPLQFKKGNTTPLAAFLLISFPTKNSAGTVSSSSSSIEGFDTFNIPPKQLLQPFQRMQKNGTNLHTGSGQGPLHQLSNPPHLLTAEEALHELCTDPESGLTEVEAKARLQQTGPNELQGGGGVNPLRILAGQIFNAMVLVSCDLFHSSFTVG
jgi:hypothetical protein